MNYLYVFENSTRTIYELYIRTINYIQNKVTQQLLKKKKIFQSY